MPGTEPTRPPAPELWLALAAIAAATLAYLPLARGGPPAASGLVGHGLGIAGFAVMLFAGFGHSWRKRVARGAGLSMRRSLQAHVFAGTVGPYLVLLHTAFAFRGLAGVLTLLVAVVVASGFVGRFAYTAAPREAQPGAPGRTLRPGLALWYVFHAPLSMAMFALALVHIAAVLYYAVRLR